MNEKHLYTTLGATVQSGSVTDETITDSSVIEIYFDEPDVYIKSSSQSGHTVNFTVDGNLTGVNVCVVVNNLTDFVPYDGEGIENRVSALESDIDTITSEIETLDNKVDNLSASNINYDEHSTLYSAMGDIDELETESKNLVGAINENFTYVSNGKSLIASAITDKGVETESDATFEVMANNISQISGGGGGDSGYIAYACKAFKKEEFVSYTGSTARGIVTIGDDNVTIQSTLTSNNYTYGGLMGVYVAVDVTDLKLIMFETTRTNTNGRIHTFAFDRVPTSFSSGSSLTPGDYSYGALRYPTDASGLSRFFLDVSNYSGVYYVGISNTAPNNTMTLRKLFALK